MSDEIPTPAPFEPYVLTVSGEDYTVLEPEVSTAHRVQTPAGRVIGLPCADSSAVLTPETLAPLLVDPPERILTAAEAEALLDAILDGWAKEWGYASAARCITYRGSANAQFAAEADAMFAARDALWTATAAAPSNPETPPFTAANVRAFAAAFKPTRP